MLRGKNLKWDASPSLSVWRYSYTPEKTSLQPPDFPCASSSLFSSSLGIAGFGWKWLTNTCKLGLESRKLGYPPIAPRGAPMNKAAFARSPLLDYTAALHTPDWIPMKVKGSGDSSRSIFNTVTFFKWINPMIQDLHYLLFVSGTDISYMHLANKAQDVLV